MVLFSFYTWDSLSRIPFCTRFFWEACPDRLDRAVACPRLSSEQTLFLFDWGLNVSPFFFDPSYSRDDHAEQNLIRPTPQVLNPLGRPFLFLILKFHSFFFRQFPTLQWETLSAELLF